MADDISSVSDENLIQNTNNSAKLFSFLYLPTKDGGRESELVLEKKQHTRERKLVAASLWSAMATALPS